VDLGSTTVILETWPNFRIGSCAWPSGFLLAKALSEGLEGLPVVKDQQVAELGAGPGLPGLVCGKLGAASVSLTDYAELVPLLRQNIKLNGLEGNCSALALDWPLAPQSSLAVARRPGGPLDVVLAADVVYFEEQDPLVDALEALMAPRQTVLVLAYRERTSSDRFYLQERILPRLEAPQRIDYGSPEHGSCEIYIGCLR
ncbi:unnamed protein product, partial [Polarella glacialis]